MRYQIINLKFFIVAQNNFLSIVLITVKLSTTNYHYDDFYKKI